MLMGKQVDTTKLGGANGLSFVIPLAAIITQDNLESEGLVMCEGKPDAYLLDDIMTDEEVQQYFVK
jgi:ribose transport system substrate-binding protein